MGIKKILIIQSSSSVGVLLSTPIIRSIKTQLSDVTVHVLTKNSNKLILQENPYLDKIITLTSNTLNQSKKLRREHYDYVIDLENTAYSYLIKKRLGSESYTISNNRFKEWMYINFKINKLDNQHLVTRYFDLINSLNVKEDSQGLDYFIPEKDHVELEWLPEAYRKEYYALVISGEYYTNKMPTERLIELCDKINKPIIILGGKEDNKTGEEIEVFFKRYQSSEAHEESLKELNKKAIVFNTCGKFNLNQQASILKQSSAVFTHDTLLMHIATAFKKQIFSTWGNTVPSFGKYPYQTKFIIFENNKIDCRPCSSTGFSKCPRGHFKCMKEVPFDFYLP